MAGPIVIRVQPITPLWTGDAQQSGSQIRETGILGSLRWWYETIIRGLGLYACDPSSGSCVYEEKEKLASICLVCQLFGCTGYGRQFRLVVDASNGGAGTPVTICSKTSQAYFNSLNDPGKRHRGWRIPPTAAGPLTLSLYPMRPGALGDFENAALYHTLRFVERYGALGAKTSQGQGVVRIAEWGSLASVMDPTAWITAARSRPAKAESNPQALPSLADFIGAIATVDVATSSKAGWWKMIPLTGLDSFVSGRNPNWLPSAPAIRAQLRGWLRTNANFPSFHGNLRGERHRLMGTIQTPIGPRGSDIFATHLYNAGEQWSMRIFGFVPRGDNPVDQAVRQLLSDRNRLATELSLALGGLNVHVELYPETAVALLRAGDAHNG